MDLGLHGRKAIVCASSQGLGKACALALAQAGVSVVINGRNRAALESTACEIRDLGTVEVTAVLADVSSEEGQAALLEACPEPDILVNNNGGPPFRNFRELGRQELLRGVRTLRPGLEEPSSRPSTMYSMQPRSSIAPAI